MPEPEGVPSSHANVSSSAYASSSAYVMVSTPPSHPPPQPAMDDPTARKRWMMKVKGIWLWLILADDV